MKNQKTFLPQRTQKGKKEGRVAGGLEGKAVFEVCSSRKEEGEEEVGCK